MVSAITKWSDIWAQAAEAVARSMMEGIEKEDILDPRTGKTKSLASF